MKTDKYPVFTTDNFEEMFKRYVRISGYNQWNLKVPIPTSRQDFFNMTKSMYGCGLGVSSYSSGFGYTIEASERLYSRLPVARLWERKLGQYNGLKPFLHEVFGELSCGGVAGQHYGQFKCKGYRHRLRLQRFWKSQFVPSESVACKSLDTR